MKPATSANLNLTLATYLCGIGAGSALATSGNVFRAAEQTLAFAVYVADQFCLPFLVCVV